MDRYNSRPDFPKCGQNAPQDEPPEERLAAQAYRRILDMILSGQVPPGDYLNERKLAEQLDVSRTPVRDALLMLESEGLVIRRGRLGVQIRQMHIEEYMDALQIRLLLEPAVARMAAGMVALPDLEELETALRGILDALDDGGTGDVDRARTRWIDERLHGLICDCAGNSQLSEIVLTLRRKTQIFDLKNLPERISDTCREHQDIIDALRHGDGAQAEAAMTRHLRCVRASIIARLTRQ